MASRGERMTLTPPAMARSLSPHSRLCRAMCTATSDEEQAVSTTMLGPRRSRAYETRPAAIDRRCLPTVRWMFCSVRGQLSLPYSAVAWPTKTPARLPASDDGRIPVSYTHLRAHETRHDLVCRL